MMEREEPTDDFVYDENGEVKTKPTKAIIGTIVAFVSLVATGLTGIIDDPQVRFVLAAVLIVAGAASTAFGIYKPTNEPVTKE